MVHPTQTPLPGVVPVVDPVLQAGSARRGLSAFFVAGLISAFIGAMLPAWRHHIQADYLLIAGSFFSQNVGILLAPWLCNPLLKRQSIGRVMAIAAALAAIGFLVLALFLPPAAFWWRLAGLFLTGVGAGMLHVCVFHSVSAAYEIHPAATLNLGGALFGIGCLTSSLLVASTLFEWQVVWILIGLASIPAVFAVLYYRAPFPNGPIPEQADVKSVLSDFKNPAAILFALLLFFQFGNEGALAGWLALFLTQRLGMSPATALSLLACYWLALIVGRIAAQWLLERVHHGRLLLVSVFVPMFACLILSLTNNLFGAITGVLLAGGGFSMILPLVIEKIGHRFPYFHPLLFNGIFSIAVTGALLAPASLGVFAHYFGIGVVMGLPLVGSVMVLLLLGLILLEAKLSGRGKQSA